MFEISTAAAGVATERSSNTGKPDRNFRRAFEFLRQLNLKQVA